MCKSIQAIFPTHQKEVLLKPTKNIEAIFGVSKFFSINYLLGILFLELFTL